MNASNKAAEMSNLMLTYLGQSFDKREALDLAATCLRSLPMLQAVIPGNALLGIDLPSPGPVIMANANQILQILTNLITNAWEAIGEGQGTITLSVKTVLALNIPAVHRFPLNWQPQHHIPYACLEVADNGCGIQDMDMEKLFDPFFPANSPDGAWACPWSWELCVPTVGSLPWRASRGGAVPSGFFPRWRGRYPFGSRRGQQVMVML
jgi:two-component system cell cycle sensor histidine kinase/response regulator CckA